jgi:hypothetical protein
VKVEKDKGIAIMTFHNAYNAGAILQAYALQEFTSSLSDRSAVVLNYKCKHIDNEYKIISRDKMAPVRVIYNLFKRIWFWRNFIYSRKSYKNFLRTRIKLSEKEYIDTTLSQAEYDFTAFIVGSDQVWNSRLVFGCLPNYLLAFCDESAKKFSYAASFGFLEEYNASRNVILQNLKTFERISLREPIGIEEIIDAHGKTPEVHLDPVLLLDMKKWEELYTSCPAVEKYIVVYTVMKSDKLIKFAIQLQKATGYKLLFLNRARKYFTKNSKCIPYVYPSLLINLIRGAEYVCATSFHGIAFSIIFNKKFFTALDCDSAYNYRVDNLLAILNLKERDIDCAAADYDMDINWRDVQERLEKERERTKEYLNSIVEISE